MARPAVFRSRVLDLMGDRLWRTTEAIGAVVGLDGPGVASAIRELREVEHGGHEIVSERSGGGWTHRLTGRRLDEVPARLKRSEIEAALSEMRELIRFRKEHEPGYRPGAEFRKVGEWLVSRARR